LNVVVLLALSARSLLSECTVARQRDPNGFQYDPEVPDYGAVSNVLDVEFVRVVKAQVAATVHLR
jgi:hypothetical protein